MATFGLIQVPSNLSNLKTFPDLTRFLSAFTAQVADAFNGLVSTKDVWGTIGVSGAILSGSGNFGASLVSTGNYHIAYREPFFKLPTPLVAPFSSSLVAFPFARIAGSTLGAVDILCVNSSNVAVNNPFSFFVSGVR